MANSGKSANVVSLHITPLTENNFSDWLIDIRAHLRSRKLWKYTQEPVPDKDKGETATATKKRKDWQEKAEEAADTITPTISPAIKKKLKEAEFNDGYSMLQRLSTLLQPAGDAQFMRLTKEYYTLDIKEFKSITEFLDHVKVLEERIDATKVKLDDDKRTLLCLIMALSEDQDYRSLVQLWSISGNDMTAVKAKDMLLEEERRQKSEDDKDVRALALKDKGQANSGEVCGTCGKGHRTDRCWENHPELAPEWLQNKWTKDGTAGFGLG